LLPCNNCQFSDENVDFVQEQPPTPPSVDDNTQILQQHLKLFGLVMPTKMVGSEGMYMILKSKGLVHAIM
jgi:hypothetical protein